MLKGQLARGNNGLTKTKYITFGIEADSLKEAKPRLERIEADVLANFKVLGVRAHSLDGYERLAILHRMSSGLARLGSGPARGPERKAATLPEWIFHKTAHSAAYLPYFDSSGKQWGDNKDYE